MLLHNLPEYDCRSALSLKLLPAVARGGRPHAAADRSARTAGTTRRRSSGCSGRRSSSWWMLIHAWTPCRCCRAHSSGMACSFAAACVRLAISGRGLQSRAAQHHPISSLGLTRPGPSTGAPRLAQQSHTWLRHGGHMGPSLSPWPERGLARRSKPRRRPGQSSPACCPLARPPHPNLRGPGCSPLPS